MADPIQNAPPFCDFAAIDCHGFRAIGVADGVKTDPTFGVLPVHDEDWAGVNGGDSAVAVAIAGGSIGTGAGSYVLNSDASIG
jgi:hypothetical protein